MKQSRLLTRRLIKCYVFCLSTLSTTSYCEEAKSLLGSYTEALAAFHNAQIPLLNATTLDDDIGFVDARLAKDRAFAVLLAARRRYWGHVGDHRCRRGG